MKKTKKIIGLVSLVLASIAMAACGKGPATSEGGSTSATCKHQWVEVTEEYVAPTCTTDGKRVEKCSECGKTQEKKVSKTGHKYADVEAESVAAECEKDGKRVQECSVCHDKKETKINALGHDYVPVEGDEGLVHAPDCTTAGERKTKCSRCDKEGTTEVAPLGHTWTTETDQGDAVAPTCTEAGTVIAECTVCHEHETRTVAATGHTFGEGTTVEKDGDFVAYTDASCEKGDLRRISWSAGDVTEACAAGASEDEPNIVTSGSGWQFWGRPVGNACTLNSSGNQTSDDDHTPVPDATVVGSYFEFKFKAPEALNDYALVTDVTPSQYLNSGEDMFKANVSGDWTPGLDAEGNPIEDFRYIVELDGAKVAFEDVDTAPNGRGWYAFPAKLTLSAGEHTIRIVMAGGWKHTFYSFGLEKAAEPAPHAHTWVEGTPVTAEGKTAYKVNTCACGAKDLVIGAKDYTSTAFVTDGGVNTPDDGTMKLKKNGDCVEFTFDVPAELAGDVTVALYGYIDHFSDGNKNGEKGFFINRAANIKVELNGTAMEITNHDRFVDMGMEDAGNGNGTFTLCELGAASLTAGAFSLKYTRLNSYNLNISEIHFIKAA